MPRLKACFVLAELSHRILMDIRMLEMDRFEATRSIREKEQLYGKHTPVVAMTDHDLVGDCESGFEAGVADHVAKPIHATQLVETV